MTHDTALIITLEVRQEAGMYYVTSPTLVGLNVCGNSVEGTYQSVVKAVRALFRHNRGFDVDVIPATTDGKAFPNKIGLCQQLVVQRKAA